MTEEEREYSIAEAKSRLPALVHAVEAGGTVHISRRGRSAAVLISQAEYTRLRLARGRTPLGAAVRAWRARADRTAQPESLAPEGLRDRDPGREVDLG